jgi:hypothetical protein
MPHDFSISSTVNAQGRTVYYAKKINPDEPRFYVGSKTMYDGNHFGLFNTLVSNNFKYDAAQFAQQYGFWAYFIAPSAKAESNNSYFCLNTYDRAKFTFGFMQYAAHVPNGDFVNFFKLLLTLPNASDYFPKLRLVNGRIFYLNSNGSSSQMEDDHSTENLMKYLNPSLAEVETQELICAARFVHWTVNDPATIQIQVRSAIELYKHKLPDYHERFGLDGATAKVCAMICDIKHQGRATNDDIVHALNTNRNWTRAFTNLCGIGVAHYGSRIVTVRTHINSLEQQGIFSKTYNAANNLFV